MTTEQAEQDIQTTEQATDATAAERLAGLERENQSLREQLDTLRNVQEDAATREQRLEQAEAANARLREEAADAVVAEAIRNACETLGISADYCLNFERHNFKAVSADGGGFRIEPNVFEHLAKRAKTDPLLRQSVAAARKEAKAGDVMTNLATGNIEHLSDDQALALVDTLDERAQRKADFIERHGQKLYLNLCGRARRIKRRRISS